jgi:hypothetical protein
MKTGSADTKWAAHQRWKERLAKASFRALLNEGKHREIAAYAVAIEARTNLLFSFEKMALRDAVRAPTGARAFAQGLFDFLHGSGEMEPGSPLGARRSRDFRAGRRGF